MNKLHNQAQKDPRRRLGAWGESVAADYLTAHGFQILERNWRCGQGEIDLVAKAGEILVFVEVKTRRGRAMGMPEQGLTPYKSRKLLELGELYMAQHELDVGWRVDLVAVELDRKGVLIRCEHIPDAVLGW